MRKVTLPERDLHACIIGPINFTRKGSCTLWALCSDSWWCCLVNEETCRKDSISVVYCPMLNEIDLLACCRNAMEVTSKQDLSKISEPNELNDAHVLADWSISWELHRYSNEGNYHTYAENSLCLIYDAKHVSTEHGTPAWVIVKRKGIVKSWTLTPIWWSCQ